VAIVSTEPMSRAEFRQLLKNDDRRLELWPDGLVREKPPVTLGHSRLASRLVEFLEAGLPARRAVLVEAYADWADRPMLRPDAMVYAQDEYLAMWERVGQAGYADVPPAVAIEIRSPDQNWTELVNKCRYFVQHGAQRALIIDPQQRVVILVRQDEPDEVGLYIEDDARALDLGPLFDDRDVHVRELFALLG
jgi:Uma2 family endonuclease